MEYFNYSLEFQKKFLPKNHYNIGITLNNIGILLYKQGIFD
jgi:hypothetical protein